MNMRALALALALAFGCGAVAEARPNTAIHKVKNRKFSRKVKRHKSPGRARTRHAKARHA